MYVLAQQQHKRMDDLDERFAYFTPEHSRVPTSKRQVPPSAIKYDYGKLVSEKYKADADAESD